MAGRWFKFCADGREDEFGFGEIDEAVAYAREKWALTQIVDLVEAARRRLDDDPDAFILKDALVALRGGHELWLLNKRDDNAPPATLRGGLRS